MPAARPVPEFEFIGGRACLDFTNTLSGRLHREPVDHLREYGDLVDWSRMAGMLSASEALRLRGRWKAQPGIPKRTFSASNGRVDGHA